MRISSRLRQFTARRPWVWWLAVATCAAVTGMGVHDRLAAVDDARAQWGTGRTVLVAARDLAPGDIPAASAVERPVAMVPARALDVLEPNMQLRQRVAAGEIITVDDVTAGPGPAQHAERGTLVVAVQDPLARRVTIGMAVQIVADGITLASTATVVDMIDDIVFVAVAADVAASVAAASRADLATLVYVP